MCLHHSRATHPNLVRREGEVYRLYSSSWRELAWRNTSSSATAFVTIDELKEFIVMADVYITPYLNEIR